MKERPILFSGPMVRAILEGRKTQTRRIINRVVGVGFVTEFQESDTPGYDFIMRDKRALWNDLTITSLRQRCPYGGFGDQLWVREAFRFSSAHDDLSPGKVPVGDKVEYFADTTAHHYLDGRCRPSIHMPRWASRITLEITGIRAELLNNISEDDAIAEGLSGITKDGKLVKYGIPDRDGLPGNDDYGWHWSEFEKDSRLAYRKLWESINGPGSWDANPWVWVVEFRKVDHLPVATKMI